LEIGLSVQVDPEFRGKIDQERLDRIILQALLREGITKPFTLGLLITGDERIKSLNLKYRGQDEETDVLAFGMENDQDSFVSPPSVPLHLGDVVISYPRAVAQAEEYGYSVEEELDLLVVHGLLHLLGYDDQTDEERQRMWDEQETILRESQVKGGQQAQGSKQ
jgi:probable rRNA maturation factor